MWISTKYGRIQSPFRRGPPILMGASSKYSFKRIAEYCDGWFPIYQDEARAQTSGAIDYAEGIRLTREAWAEADREGEPSFSVFGVGPDPAAVERLIGYGFDRLIFGLPSADADTVLPMVAKYAEIAHAFNT